MDPLLLGPPGGPPPPLVLDSPRDFRPILPGLRGKASWLYSDVLTRPVAHPPFFPQSLKTQGSKELCGSSNGFPLFLWDCTLHSCDKSSKLAQTSLIQLSLLHHVPYIHLLSLSHIPHSPGVTP